jgi:hypothetical protein
LPSTRNDDGCGRRRRGRATQLGHPHTGGVEQLQHREVAQRQRRALLGSRAGRVEHGRGLLRAEHGRQRATGSGRDEPHAGVVGQVSGAVAQPVKVRAAAARRASVDRLAFAACPAASQRRRVARSSVGDVVDARQQRSRSAR